MPLDNAQVAIDNTQNTFKKVNKLSVNVQFGRQTVQIRPLEILDFFWSNSPATLCTVCGERFEENGPPPIRTVSYEFPAPNPKRLHFRVHNRHLDCLRTAKDKYISVSHAWHKEIAAANEVGRSSPDASIRVMESLVKVVDAATSSFHSDYGSVEVWHDYFSVPQYDHSTKEKLLLHLPSIFSGSSACLVHLDNFPVSFLHRLFLQAPSDKDFSDVIGAFFDSRWFQRMWVMLEYIKSPEVHLLTSDFRIFYNESDNDHLFDAKAATNGSFSDLWDWFLCKKERWPASATVFPGRFSFVDLQMFRRVRTSGLTYAEAFSIVAGKQCAIYRDRFLALCGFLNLGSNAELSIEIPKDSAGVCLWVAWKCLEAGDYTPLLLVPFSGSYREKEVPGFSWLVGHEKMIELEGNQLGPLESPPDNKTIIRDNRVRPCLERVGSIEDVRGIGNFGMDAFEQFLKVTEFIQEWHGCFALPFVSAIRRIYSLSSPSHTSDRSLLESFVSEKPEFEGRLLTLLQNLRSTSDGNPEVRLRYITILSELLNLDLHENGRMFQDWNAGNTICLVRCDHCKMSFTCRFYRYPGKSLEIQSRVFRIPGLKYGRSFRGGVGLVISDNRIVGRMMYGVPACDCKLIEIVDIE
jgi:hypothetical protein